MATMVSLWEVHLRDWNGHILSDKESGENLLVSMRVCLQ
jgi:hypothetical protein